MDSENVKEKLNSMIHKKLDQQERGLREVKQEAEDNVGVQIKQENELYVEAAEETVAEDQFKHISLQDVLNEKKRALLRNKEIIDFFSGKINSEQN